MQFVPPVGVEVPFQRACLEHSLICIYLNENDKKTKQYILLLGVGNLNLNIFSMATVDRCVIKSAVVVEFYTTIILPVKYDKTLI